MYDKVDAFAGVEDNIVDAIEAYMAKHHPEVKSVELKRRKLKARDEGAAAAGLQAGKSAQLRQAVGHKPVARLTAGV